MNENSSANRISQEPDGLHIAYPASYRIESVLLLLISAAVLVASHYYWYRANVSLLSDHNWLAIPICLLGDAGLIAAFLWSGSLKSPVSIGMDGTVREGIATWIFPGPMTALVAKTGGGKAPPRYWIDLRYGRAIARLPGDTTEGLTIGMAAQINQWSRHRIQGTSDPFDSSKAKSPVSLGNYFALLMGIVLFIGFAYSGDDTHLDVHAKLGLWAKVSAVVVALLVVSITGVRWATFAGAGVRRGVRVLLAEVVVAILLIVGSGAIAAHSAQALEMRATSEVVTTFDAPLMLTATTNGKGCHRYLIFNDPSLGRVIQYCDPHSLEYWNETTRVQVTEGRNDLGVHILSINRVEQP